MMTITTNSSSSVKPRARAFRKWAGSYILYIVGATVRAWKALELCGLLSPIVIKDHRARQWAGALVNGGEARKPRVGDYGRSAAALLGEELMVDGHDGGYIMTGFGEGRNAAAVALDRRLTGVISGQRQLQIIAEARHQVAQIVRPRGYVLFGIEGVGHPVAPRRRGPKLHQPLRATLRYRDGAALRGVRRLRS